MMKTLGSLCLALAVAIPAAASAQEGGGITVAGLERSDLAGEWVRIPFPGSLPNYVRTEPAYRRGDNVGAITGQINRQTGTLDVYLTHFYCPPGKFMASAWRSISPNGEMSETRMIMMEFREADPDTYFGDLRRWYCDGESLQSDASFNGIDPVLSDVASQPPAPSN